MNMKIVKLVVSLVFLSGPSSVAAGEAHAGLVDACLAAAPAEARAGCIGKVSDACIAGAEGGETTLGMSMCMADEAEVWDRLLNAEYRKTMARAKAMDSDEAESFPQFANRAVALRDAQRAWIAFRDAECALAYAEWGAGSMRHIAGSECVMRMTAQRALELRAMRESPQ